MIVSRITANADTRVPAEVRQALGVASGDRLSWEIHGDRIVLRRLDDGKPAGVVADLSQFGEWASDADEKAFADL